MVNQETGAKLPDDFKLGIITSEWDASITEQKLQSIEDDDDVFKELELSRKDLYRIFAAAKEIVQELHPTDEILDLTYDTDRSNWYINFKRPDADGRWNAYIYREDQNLAETLAKVRAAVASDD